jgi:uncharacterized protein
VERSLTYLIDTNVWLELLLEQEHASDVRVFLQQVEPSQLAITDFALFSIALILCRLKKDNLFLTFLNDLIRDHNVAVLRIGRDDLAEVISVKSQYNLDFDDAYQHCSASMNNCTLVSFDADFERTPQGRITPSEIIKALPD